jgi:hypothetical protein
MIDVVGLWDENQWVVGKVLVPFSEAWPVKFVL